MSAVMDFVKGIFGGGKKDEPKMPSIQAKQPKRTAERMGQDTEQAKRNKMLAASLITKDWGKPKLGAAGLLG